MKSFKILVINPGSTSTKIAVYENDKEIFEATLRHHTEELEKFDTVADQFEFRKDVILRTLSDNNINVDEFSAISTRGGGLKPIEGGTYKVCETILEDSKTARFGEHASNLACLIGDEIAKDLNIPVFLTDPPVVDELDEIARQTGIEGMVRRSRFHALNQKAVARKGFEELGKTYTDGNCIVAHLGGGVSVSAHRNGHVIDTNDAYMGAGPMTPERAGTVESGEIIKMCFSGKYTLKEIKKILVGKGGLTSRLGTSDAREVSERVKNGDKKAEMVYSAMAYQVSKEIGNMATVLKGDVDFIAITGGIAYSTEFVQWISERVSFIAPIRVYPGEFEMSALALATLRVLNKEEVAKSY